MIRPPRRGFTVIELLVVISIIGMLMSLLLPAIQAAREVGRRTVCANNLRQLGLAMLEHEQAHGRFPSGGWGGMWVTDPDRGSSRAQPGGWVHPLLPYLERHDAYEIGRGAADDKKPAAIAQLLQTSFEVFHCPSRRSVGLYPIGKSYARTPLGSDPVDEVARTDYAANAGDQGRCDLNFFDAPRTLAEGDDPKFAWPDLSDHTGICYLRSEIRMAHIRDGTPHTYLLGEKRLSDAEYFSGLEHGDDWSMYTGYQDDVFRTTSLPPASDYAEFGGNCGFGSAHPGSFNMMFCDGSLRTVDYDIDPEIHRRLGNRRDGEPLNDADLPW